METVGKNRGCLKTGGQVDLDKASKILLNELRTGMLGRISLETPDMMVQELAELEILREQIALKKKARKEKWKPSIK
jgi:ribosome biogenesis GTPase A